MNGVASPHAQQTESREADERWELVRRVAASRHLSKAPQLREILLYISQRALAEHATSISEQEIGCKVLGRRPDFSPNDDNIVRVQIRHLRKKLEEYFQGDGAAETLNLTIPKGGYIPHFEPRQSNPAPEVAVAAMGIPAIGAPPAPRPRAFGTVAILALLLLAVITATILWKTRGVPRPGIPADDAPAAHEDPLWSRIFAPNRETTIVVADTNLVMVQDIMHTDVPLGLYLKGGYPEKLINGVANPDLQRALRLISGRQYTSLGDAILANKFMDLGRRHGAAPHMRYSRYVNVRDFKAGNFVLIGSRRGVPLEQLFESQLNFDIEEDHATRQYHLRNKSPLPGERLVYGISSGDPTNQDTYADVALLPNLAGTGYVLVLCGIDMAATEAAGEFVTGPDFGSTLARLMSARPGQPPASYIEILLQAKATAGTSEGAKIIAYRHIDPPRATP